MSNYDKINGAKVSYNYCQVCGRRPTEDEESNWTPLKWWDEDDGWRIGTLCRWCWEDCCDKMPSDEDFAVINSDGEMLPIKIDTDEDPMEILEEIL